MLQQNLLKLDMLLFQHNLYDLQNEYFGVLERKGFGEKLLTYLNGLIAQDQKRVVLRILGKLEVCSTKGDRVALRQVSISLVLDFAKMLLSNQNKDFLKNVVGIVARWLSKEKAYQEGFSLLLKSVKSLIQDLFSLHMWAVSEPLVSATQNVISRADDGDCRLRREVYLLHRQIIHSNTIKSLVQDYYRGGRNNETERLLFSLRPFTAEPMVQALVKAKKKELRLSLLATLGGMRQGILPVVLEKLWNRQTWYVIRNCIMLLGTLKDPDLFPFAKPFFHHPDVRVQRQVLHCIVALGGDEVVSRLISSYDIISADTKLELVKLLSDYEDPQIGNLYLKILDSRENLPSCIKNQLIKMICQSGQLSSSSKAASVLADIRRDCDRSSIEDKSLMNAVAGAQQSFLDVPKKL